MDQFVTQDQMSGEESSIRYYKKGQRLQWFGHIMRKSEEETIRAVIKWKPQGRRPRDRPRKKWLDVLEDNLKLWEYKNGRKLFKIERNGGI